MAGLPPGQEAGPTAELPPWLSYTSSATATLEVVYTYATLLQNGIPTLATSAAVVTQYGTDLLQLPITVDASAVAGQNLGTLYTTAGGTGTETVVGIVGGTERVTLGATPSTATAGSVGDFSVDPTNPAASDAPSAAATATTTASMAFSSANDTPAANGGSEASSSPSADVSTPTSTAIPSTSSTDVVTSQRRSTATAASSSSRRTRSALSDPSTSLKLGITPIPSLRLPPTSNNLATGLTPSQLAAAIASPICFFFAVVLLLAFFCCCVRHRRRKRAQQRALAEEESLLETPETNHSGGVESGRDARTISGGILWDWVPRRVPSRVSDWSGQSVLSRLTGGLVGGRRSRSRSNRSRAATTPRSSPLEGEKFFGTAVEKPSHRIGYPQTMPNEQTSLLSPHSAESVHHAVPSPRGHWSALPQATSPPMTFLGAPVSAITALQRPGDKSTVPNVRDQRLAEPFDDVDLTSPRLDLGDFEPLPLANNEDRTLQYSPPPSLPPIRPSGEFRLTRLYNVDGTYAGAYLPPSPSSYTAPPTSPPSRRPEPRLGLAPPITGTGHSPGRLGIVRRATTTLSEIWNGYETASPNTDDGLGTFGGAVGEPSSLLGASPKKRNSAAWYRPSDQPSAALRTPPQTPTTPRAYGVRSSRAKESPAPRTPSPRRQQERILSEGGWLSGRIAAYMAGEGREESAAEDEGGDLGGLRQRPVSTNSSSGRTADLTRTPESNLFMNDPQWRGRPPQPPLSPPPFTSFHLVEDAPVALNGSDPSLLTTLAHDALTPSVTGSSGSDSSAQRYKDAFDPQSSPRRQPFHPSSRVEVVGRNPNRMSYESGVSVLGRIAASFGALRSKRSESSASDWDSPRRGPQVVGPDGLARSRTREVSVESAADPFQQKFRPTLSPPPPSVVSPATSQFDAAAANVDSLRHSSSQPVLTSPMRTSPGRMLFRPSRPGSAYEGPGYLDPFEDGDEQQ